MAYLNLRSSADPWAEDEAIAAAMPAGLGTVATVGGEAAVRVMIIEIAPVGTALLVSKVMPYAVAALLIVWTQAYGKRARRRGERLTAAPLSADPDRTPELQEVAA